LARPLRMKGFEHGCAAAVAAIAFACSSAPLRAEFLAAPATLRADPQTRAKILVIAPAGANVRVYDSGRAGWSAVAIGELLGFTPTKRLKLTDIPEGDAAAVAVSCDFGYPYSGSAPYFSSGLTPLRTSEPLSFLFGRHIARPC